MRYHYVDELIVRRPHLSVCKLEIERFCDILIDSYKDGGKVLVCGNGGSASDAAHIVGELMKGFLKRRELPTTDKERLSVFGKDGTELADNLQGSFGAIDLTVFHALSTAIANDMNADYIYAQTLLGLGKPNDVFVGISTSGNARNVHLAAIVAKERDLMLVGLTGKDGGKMRESGLYDVLVRAPESETYKIQEEHIAIYHVACMSIEEQL
jgi:D-sedoheptulose 7-phosphate isomerase